MCVCVRTCVFLFVLFSFLFVSGGFPRFKGLTGFTLKARSLLLSSQMFANYELCNSKTSLNVYDWPTEIELRGKVLGVGR